MDADARLERIRRSLARDPWRPLYPFPRARALQRDAQLTVSIHNALAKAEAATSEWERNKWIVNALNFERSGQYARSFPFDMWFRSFVIAEVKVPWGTSGACRIRSDGIPF